jgi:hypothetical protein
LKGNIRRVETRQVLIDLVVNIALVEEGQNEIHPASHFRGSTGENGVGIHVGPGRRVSQGVEGRRLNGQNIGRELLKRRFEVHDRQPLLLQIVLALTAPRRFASLLNCRQQ